MAYTAVLSATLSGTPTLGNIRIAVDGQTISSGITATSNSNGSGFEATVTTLSDGFRGPFTFYDSTDATNFATGSVGPEHELVDAAVSTRSSHSAADVRTEVDSNSTQLAAIVADTNELQTDDVPGLITALNNLSTSDVDARLAAYDTPTKAEMDAAFATTDGLITTVDGIVDAILVDTDATIPALITALNNLSAADVNAEVDTALADYDGPTKAEMDSAFATTDGLIGTVDGIVDAILVDTDVTIPALISALNNLSAADVNAQVDTALADYDAPTKAELDTAQAAIQSDISGLNDLSTADIDARLAAAEPLDANITEVTGTAVTDVDDFKADVSGITVDNAAIADAVWDEATADHVAAGSFGLLISTVATASAVAQQVWQYATRTLTSTANVTSSSVSGSRIEIVRDVTFTNTWSNVTIPATWSKAYFTVKCDADNDSDNDALIQLVVTNGGDAADGLLRINGGSATAANGSLTLNDVAETVVATVADDATAKLSLNPNAEYDIKFVLADGTSQLALRKGFADIVSTPTKTI